jgi:hypothetical protein
MKILILICFSNMLGQLHNCWLRKHKDLIRIATGFNFVKIGTIEQPQYLLIVSLK